MDEEKRAGLSSRGGRAVPLVGVSVQAEVLGATAQVVVRQRYRNDEARPVEAIYTFPLPSRATLAGFSMTCDGRRVEGEVVEREAAFARYDEAVATGHGAAMLEQERLNVFTASVGNLLPGEETMVEIIYLERLASNEGGLRWALPTVVAPRYTPGRATGQPSSHGARPPTDLVPDADRVSPPVGDASYALSLDLLVDLGREVVIESPSHSLSVKPEGEGRARVSLSGREPALDRDLVVLLRSTSPEPLFSLAAHRDGEGGYFAVSLVPDFGARPASMPLEVVFVVDTSGSMQGASLAQAKMALRLCLRHLREGDRFNVIAFSDGFRALADVMLSFDDASLDRADAFVAELRAHGGTEIEAPLVKAARMCPDGVLVLLTDGEVSNEQQVVRALRGARRSARVHSFAVGTAASDALLEMLARETGGAVEHVFPGERLDDKVVAQFSRAIAPRVEGLAVSVEGLDAGELTPWPPPPLVDGEPWALFGRYDAAGQATVRLRGTLLGEPFTADVPLVLPDASSHPQVAKFWASERIRDLGSASLEGRRAEAMRARIASIACRHGVSSPHTAFVLVEKRQGERRSHEQPAARVVPVSLPAGWAPSPTAGRAPSTPASTVLRRRLVHDTRPGPPKSGIEVWSGRPSVPMPAGPPARSLQAQRAGGGGGGGGAGGGGAGGGGGARRWDDDRWARSAERGRGGSSRNQLPFEHEDDAVWSTPSLTRRAAPPAPAPGEPSSAPPSEPGDQARALLARQLGSGLWTDPALTAATDVRQVIATVAALRALLSAGIGSAHPVHGGQIQKAVAALLVRASKLAREHPALARLAFAAAWLVSEGQRSRHEVCLAARAARVIDSQAERLGDDEVLRRALDGADLISLCA